MITERDCTYYVTHWIHSDPGCYTIVQSHKRKGIIDIDGTFSTEEIAKQALAKLNRLHHMPLRPGDAWALEDDQETLRKEQEHERQLEEWRKGRTS